MLVVVYVPQSFYAVDLAAICDALTHVNRHAATTPRYDVRVVADSHTVRSTSGLLLTPDVTMRACREDAELLIVCPSEDWQTPPDRVVVDWLRRQAEGAKRYGAVGSGAFLLAATGLLNGRRVTTHWHCAPDLAQAFPAVLVEEDCIYVFDGPVFTSAGGIAALDLALTLVEADHGRDIALEMARSFILFMKRAGGQAQLSLSLETQTATRDPIQRAQQHIRDNPADDLSVTALAAVAAMSPRNFARVFVQETGMRPTDYVEILRVNLARRMLEETALPPQQIARLCGFSGSEAARRAFRRRGGVTMTEFRAGLHAGGGVTSA